MHARLAGPFLLVALSSCSWVLPRPGPRPGDVRGAAAVARCDQRLREARQAASATKDTAGLATPLLIATRDALLDDRAVRNGMPVTFAPWPESTGARAHQSTAGMALQMTGASALGPLPLRDQSAVRLVPTGPAATHPPLVAEIVKADVPDPNRPSTCDDTIRDGDAVWLRAVTPRRWMRVVDGELRPAAAAADDAALALEPTTACATDRYGGLVCARIPGTGRASQSARASQ